MLIAEKEREKEKELAEGNMISSAMNDEESSLVDNVPGKQNMLSIWVLS